MDTALYYTFSTIAQSLAAAMGLLSAFALYRLGAINNECTRSAEMMEAETNGGSDVRALAYISNWEGVCKAIENRVIYLPQKQEEMGVRCARIRQLASAHVEILRSLWISLGLTAMVVASSIWALALVPRIVASNHAAHALNAGIAATVVCLISYLALVVAAFRGVK